MMLNRKTGALLCLYFSLAAFASAAVVSPSKRQIDIARVPGSSQQQRPNKVHRAILDNEARPISPHVLIPRSKGQTTGEGQPEEPERLDETGVTEERQPESVPPGAEWDASFPQRVSPSRAEPVPSNPEENVNYRNGNNEQGIGQSIGTTISPNIIGSEAKDATRSQTLVFPSFGVAIIYSDYVDRIKFSVYRPGENILYECSGGIYMIEEITEFPEFAPCNRDESRSGPVSESQSSISFAVDSLRVRAPLTSEDPLVVYVKYDNTIENESWTVPAFIDDSKVELISQIPEARQYRYGTSRPMAFQSPAQVAEDY